MQRIVPALIALSFGLTAGTFAAEPGTRERTFVCALEVFDSAKTQADYRESAALLESVLADGYQNGAAYYNLETRTSARENRPGDRGVSQGQTVSPARSLSGSEPAASTHGGPWPHARIAYSLVETRVVLERLVVIPREGLWFVRRFLAGCSGGMPALLFRWPRAYWCSAARW